MSFFSGREIIVALCYFLRVIHRRIKFGKIVVIVILGCLVLTVIHNQKILQWLHKIVMVSKEQIPMLV